MNCKKIWKKAEKIIPGGNGLLSKRPQRFLPSGWPIYYKKAKGIYLWTLDNKKLIDFSIMGIGTAILGYANSDVDKKVKKAIDNGINTTLNCVEEYYLAKEILKYNQFAQQVKFAKGGGEAMAMAIRIARTSSKKYKVVFSGYHGWHDWYIANTDLNSGIPDFNKKLAHSFSYNDLDSLEKIFKEYPDQIAIVIMEPLTVLKPKNNFLHEVKKMARHYGAILMFDEIISGFRFSLGGAQELLDVTPDLASFAKGISNGVPLSALVGKKEYMEALDKTFFSFTYGGDCIGLSAAEACIPKLQRENVSSHLWKVGKVLKDGFNQLAETHNLEEFMQCIGYPCRSIISFNGRGKYNELELKSILQQELVRRGVLWAAYHALSWSHTIAEINLTLEAYDESMSVVKNIITKGGRVKDHIEGSTITPVFRKVADFNSYTVKGVEGK